MITVAPAWRRERHPPAGPARMRTRQPNPLPHALAKSGYKLPKVFVPDTPRCHFEGIVATVTRLIPLPRRAFLGIGAALAGGGAVAAAKLATAGQPGGHPAAAEPGGHPGAVWRRRVVRENALPGDRHWRIRHLGFPSEIEGYAGQASVLPGQPVRLYVSTTSAGYRVAAFRMGWYGGDLARRVWASGPQRGRRQHARAMARNTNTVRADWEPSLTVPTDGWPEGSYLFRLDADSGAQRYVPLTVRSAHTAGKVVIKNAVATWQAYNTWGGYDLYNGPGGITDYANRALAVSLDRPSDGNGAPLFGVYERKVIELAERIGLPLAYVTSMDIAARPHLLDGASALISPGHDEYWCPAERASVTAARDAGVNLAFLGANAMFRRTRLAPTALGPGRLIICYKTSYLQDPMYGRHNALVTSDWREPPHPDAESSLTGTLYESNPTTADFVVRCPGAWLFRGTGVRKGSRFRGLVGTEYDRVNPGYHVERPIQVLSHSRLTCRGIRSFADSAYYTHHGGAGVFNAGTMRWVESFGGPNNFGIDAACGAFTRRVTANVLRAFADGPAAAKYPAHDNMHAIREWPGDPIAAQHDLW